MPPQSRNGPNAFQSSRSGWEGAMVESSNVDDSTILSDLVRTGEASRLRRRGALRLDRNSLGHHRHFSFDSEPGDSDEENRPHGERPHFHHPSYHSSSRWVSHLGDDEESDESYLLVCGAEVDPQSHFGDGSAPFQPSLLPIEPAKQSSTSPRSFSRPTNGCGAIAHIRASSSSCSIGVGKTYIARTPATDSVTSLPAEYFQAWPGVKFETSSCGCVKEGVGCAVCGNPLGTRWKFCKTMAEGRRKAPWRESRRLGPLGPEGPSYWLGTPSRSTSRTRGGSASDETEFYTFFPNAVTAFREPEPPSAQVPVLLPPTEPNSPVFTPQPYEGANWLPPRRTPQRRLAVNVEVTVASYSDTTPYLAEDTITTPQRPPLTSVQSAPAIVYAYNITSSPESMSVALPQDDSDSVTVSVDSQGPVSSPFASPLGQSFDLRQSVPIDSSPIRFATDLSDDEDLQPMSFYHEQVLGASHRERRELAGSSRVRQSLFDASESIVDGDGEDSAGEVSLSRGVYFDR